MKSIKSLSQTCFNGDLSRCLIVLLLCLSSALTMAQNQKIDSLLSLLKSSDHDTILVDGYLKMAHYHSRRNLDSAMIYAQMAHQFADRDIGMKLKVSTYNSLGLMLKLSGDLDSALFYYQLNESLVYEYDQPEELGRYHNNLGNLYQVRNQKLQAYEHYLEALDFFKQADNPKEVANAQNNIAINFLLDGEFRKGLSYLFRAYHLRDSIGSEYGVIGSLANIGVTYKDLEMYDSASYYLEESLERSKKIDNTRGIALALNNLSLVSKKAGDLDKSETYLKDAIALNHRLGSKSGLMSCYVNISGLLLRKQEFTGALAYADSTSKISDEIGALNYKKSAVQIMGQVHQELGNYEVAIKYFAEHDVLKDSIYNIEKTRQIQELEGKYQSSQKDIQIASLELAKKNAALSLATSNNQRNIFISAFIIFFIVAGFLFYRYQSKKKNADLLTLKNNQITMALEERETLLKEIHHRVKNNLQIISSLLNLQAGSLEDEAAVNAVKEGQHRVKSMALIHQKLYSDEDIRGVDIQDYFENLLTALFSAFGVKHIDHMVSTNGIKLDIDTVIPIGLIVNELITNSIKYAFNGMEEGKLNILVTEKHGKLELIVQDSGTGMDEEALQASNSFGWKMIRSLSRKLKAEISIVNEQGTAVHLIMHKYKLVI